MTNHKDKICRHCGRTIFRTQYIPERWQDTRKEGPFCCNWEEDMEGITPFWHQPQDALMEAAQEAANELLP